MTNAEKVFLCFLILVLCIISITLGYEMARVSNAVKSEIINKYNMGEIACAQVSNELVCREVQR